MKRLIISKGRLVLSEEIIGFFKKRVTKFGTGAKVDCPKEYLGKDVYLVICKNGDRKRGRALERKRKIARRRE